MLRIHCCPSILRRLCVAGSAIAVVWAPLALAQPLPEDSATRLAARQLAQEGGELFDEGRFAEAQERLRRAHALYPAPTIAVLEAKALLKLGRLVEASDRYQVAERFQLAEDSPEAFAQAVQEARAELDQLGKRLTVDPGHVLRRGREDTGPDR